LGSLFGNAQESSCQLDGIPTNCDLAMRLQHNGSAMQCPMNDCGPRAAIYTNSEGERFSFLTLPFMAFGDGSFGFFYGSWAEMGSARDQAAPPDVSYPDGAPNGNAYNFVQQPPWRFNEGYFRFTDEEWKRIYAAAEKVRSERCRKWFEDTIKALGKPDLAVRDRETTMEKLFERAEFNRYDPKLTAEEMRITPAQRKNIADHYEKLWTNGWVANAVTLAPDYTRIFLMPTAFWRDEGLLGNWSGRDLSGILAFELLHVAGYSDKAIWSYRDALQQHCGDPSDAL